MKNCAAGRFFLGSGLRESFRRPNEKGDDGGDRRDNERKEQGMSGPNTGRNPHPTADRKNDHKDFADKAHVIDFRVSAHTLAWTTLSEAEVRTYCREGLTRTRTRKFFAGACAGKENKNHSGCASIL